MCEHKHVIIIITKYKILMIAEKTWDEMRLNVQSDVMRLEYSHLCLSIHASTANQCPY